MTLLPIYLALFAVSSAEKILSNSCAPRFRTDPQHFESCRTQVCFLLQQQEPFVVIDPRMKQEGNQTVFRCRDRSVHFPGLYGAAFSIKDAIPSLHDALCVYGGEKCKFNDMVDFIQQHAETYKFATPGLLLEISSRISPHLVPSASIFDSEIVIIGRHREGPRLQGTFRALRAPFDISTWVLLVCMSVIFLVLYYMQVWVPGRPVTVLNIVRIAVEGPDVLSRGEKELGLEDEEIRLTSKLAAAALKTAFSAFLVITILFYEVSVVNHVFLQSSKVRWEDVNHLSESDLRKFIVTRGTATETIWRRHVDPYERYEPPGAPWHTCDNTTDCHNILLNKNHPAQFFVTPDFTARYLFSKNDPRDRLAVYETEKPLYSCSAGWLWNTAVPGDVRRSVDRSILDLRLTGTMRRIMSKAIDNANPRNGRSKIKKIDIGLMVPIFFVFLVPLVFVVIGAVVRVAVIRTRARQNTAAVFRFYSPVEDRLADRRSFLNETMHEQK